MEKKELYFLEYSLKQGCFHIDSAERSLKHNLYMLSEGGQNDYVPIYVGTEIECINAADRWRSIFKPKNNELTGAKRDIQH